MQDLLDKIKKELEHMELNARSFKMGLVNFDPYYELHKHHISKVVKYLDEMRQRMEEPVYPDRGGGVLH